MAATQRTYHKIDSPRLGNQYLEDTPLRGYLQYFVRPELLPEIERDLIAFGDRCVSDLMELGAFLFCHSYRYPLVFGFAEAV